MARPLYASFLPTIKCSSCGVEIEISSMGDHLCGGSSDDSQSQIGRTDHDRISASTLTPAGNAGIPIPSFGERRKPNPSLLAPGSKSAANAQSSPPEKPSPSERQPLPGALSAGAVPTIKSFQAPQMEDPAQRGVSQPVPAVQLANFDFTSGESSGPNSQRPLHGISRPNAPDKLSLAPSSITESAPTTSNGPISPSILGGANLLKRMDSIAPGPFNSRSTSKRYVERNGMRSPGIAPGPAIAEAGDLNRSPSFTGPAPARPARPETDESLLEQLQSSNKLPLQQMQAGDQQPLRSFSFDDPSETESAINSVKGAETPKETVGPLPNFSQSPRSHSLTDSESSTVSQSVSDSRTVSSRSSSSPTSASSPDAYRKPSFDQNYAIEPIQAHHTSLNAVIEDVASPSSDTATLSPVSEVTPRSLIPAQSTRTSSASHSSTTQGNTWGASVAHQSPESEVRLSSLRYDPSVANGRASGPVVMPPPPEEAKKRVRSMASKGKCRGCEEMIIGKSIKAADGRLSGRWHRECFKCHTCKTPFQTADFYVLDDQPYCAQHYHELNQSICQHCNTGIEGRYVQTSPSQKYHVDCFVCQDCRKPLTSDYFEMNHRFYCESDAYRVWQKSKMLTPGRRFPERRQTRIMTTS